MPSTCVIEPKWAKPFEEDVLEIILRGSNSYLEKHLRPMIWPSIGKAKKPSPSFIFAEHVSDNDIGSIAIHQG